MIQVETFGSLKQTTDYLLKLERVTKDVEAIFKSYGKAGVDALARATPVDSGITAESWGYGVKSARKSVELSFYNSNIAGNIPLAILIQYGHGTRQGGYVGGRDYINPAIGPVFKAIIDDIRKELAK